MFAELTHFLAQSDSSNMGDFFGQISGLLLLTCGAGIVWMGLMALVFQRAAERRRRAAAGLPPLPGIHVAAYRWLTGQREPAAVSAGASPAMASPARQRPAARSAPVPAPDLSLLTGDLPQPEFSDLVPDDEPAPAADQRAGGHRRNPAAGDDAMRAEPPRRSRWCPPSRPARPSPRMVELLRVWRDLSDGSLVVEIGGRRFQSLVAQRRPERRFLNVARPFDPNGRLPRPPLPRLRAAWRPRRKRAIRPRRR